MCSLPTVSFVEACRPSTFTDMYFPLRNEIRLRYCCQIFLFTEATRGGVTGLVVAKHVDGHGELSTALVHVPILRQQTKEEVAWEQTKKLENVTSVDVQVINIFVKEL